MKLSKVMSAAALCALVGMSAVPAAGQGAPAEGAKQPNFIMFSGKVKEVQKPTSPDVAWKETILAQNGEGGEVAFKVNDNTYFATDKKAEPGAQIIGFYDAKAPMTMIYPPSPDAKVIAIGLEKGKSIKVDRFDKDLVSEDGQLKLNIGANTKIILQNSQEFDGDLANRALAVIYGPTTRSIPAQTTPDKIVVLYETAAAPIHTLTDEEKNSMSVNTGAAQPVAPIYTLTEQEKANMAKVSKELSIGVNGYTLPSAKPYVNENGVFMLPVRAVADMMDLSVEWFADTNTVQVGKSASFVVGKDAYSKDRMAPVELYTASVSKNDVTYVPLEFFTKIIGAKVNYTPNSIELTYPMPTPRG